MIGFEEKVIPLDHWVSQFVDSLVEGYRPLFQALKWPVEALMGGMGQALLAIPPVLVVLALAVLAWRASGVKLAVFTALSLVFIGLLGFWDECMITLAMVFAAVIFCVITGIPLGILAGRSDRYSKTGRRSTRTMSAPASRDGSEQPASASSVAPTLETSQSSTSTT